jgi:hypothetical protein
MKRLLQLAPLAVFVFKRPAHTQRMLKSLAGNPEFAASPLYIYCDGARNEAEAVQVEVIRKLVRDWPHPNKTLIERDRNWGLANSVIAGVTELCERYGRVIVVEDDLIVSPVFLNYLNSALERYADEPKVMQVSAHMFPVSIQSTYDAVMLPFTTSWGWATWDGAWKHFDPSMSGYEKLKTDSAMRRKFNLDGSYPYFRMLKRQMCGKVDSWAIRWYKSVFFQGGLTLYPCHSLVRNDGYGVSATHTSRHNRREVTEIWQKQILLFPPCRVDREVTLRIYKFLRSETSLLRWLAIRLNLLRLTKLHECS